MKKNYQKIEKLQKRIYHLRHMRSMLGWDEAVMMPSGSGNARANAMAELAILINECFNNQEIGSWIENALNEDISQFEKINVIKFKDLWTKNLLLSPEFLEHQTLITIKSEQAWRELRKKNDWKNFAPYLEEVVKISIEEARIRGQKMNMAPYDAMLDLYSPGLTDQYVQDTFKQLKEKLPSLIQQITEKQKNEKVPDYTGQYPIQAQKEIGLELMAKIGFNFNKGRLDVSHHPFCGGVSEDVRLTTRYDQEDFSQSLMGVLHETGHALYEQHLPDEWRNQVVGSSLGMSIHESQSLFVEMQVCRSKEFLKFCAPVLARHFNSSVQDPKWNAQNLFLYYTRVTPGLIRVDADEVTYPLHVILRYEIEKDLMLGKLEVKDLPEVWNEKMKKYLGLTTLGDDKNGCMQDVHWPSGAFGYFPAYTFGSLIASQLFATVKKKIPNLASEIESGNFKPLTDWLNLNIWKKGSFTNTQELIESASGEKLNTKYFFDHINERYLN